MPRQVRSPVTSASPEWTDFEGPLGIADFQDNRPLSSDSDSFEQEMAEALAEIDWQHDHPSSTSRTEPPTDKRTRDANSEGQWARLARHVPDEIRQLFEHIRVPGYRIEALADFEDEVFEWANRASSASQSRTSPDAASVRLNYKRLSSSTDYDATKQLARRVIDRKLRVQHHLALEDDPIETKVVAGLPSRGFLRIRDTSYREPPDGLRSYLEATPIEVPEHALQVLESRRPLRLATVPLQCWDLTAGSGTVQDYVCRTRTAKVVSTDLAIASRHTRVLDLRNVVRNDYHTLRSHEQLLGRYVIDPREVIQHPDIVFLDPPSRGRPSHSKLYTGLEDKRDLANLTRQDWIDVVADTVRRCLGRLNPGGLISLVVREGCRNHQVIDPESGLPEALLSRLEDVVTLVDRKRVAGWRRVNQASLIKCRLPAVHLLLGHKSLEGSSC